MITGRMSDIPDKCKKEMIAVLHRQGEREGPPASCQTLIFMFYK